MPITKSGVTQTSIPSTVGHVEPIHWRERAFLQMQLASDIVGVSITSLYRLSDQGLLKLRDIAGRTLVDTKSVIALIDTAQDWKPKNRGHKAREMRKQTARAGLRA